jgi:prepilin-type N-terminal cleavage/methylation domain-containing protein
MRQPTPRGAFTLIELLIVLAIIGVLASLLMAAVMRTVGKGEEVQARSDISQLAQGIQAFQARYGVKEPPPSRLFLGRSKADYCSDAPACLTFISKFHQDSYEYLTRVWPRLVWTKNPMTPIAWADPAPTGPRILEGHQCLVFFLGGIPTITSGPGCLGFSSNPTNPALLGGDRIAFFDFKPIRLVDAGGGFLAYKDAYGKQPYAYFSSYRTTNNFNRHYALLQNSDCFSLPASDKTGKTVDKFNKPLSVWPYLYAATPIPRYINPDSFQIICAGQDGIFGPGGDLNGTDGNTFWVPNSAMYSLGMAGYDDLSNFHDKLLGIPN